MPGLQDGEPPESCLYPCRQPLIGLTGPRPCPGLDTLDNTERTTTAQNMLFFKQKKRKDFILPLKVNRKVALSLEAKERGHWLPVSSLAIDTDAGVTIYLEQVPFALRLVRHVLTNEDGSTSVLYLVSSDLALSGPQMVASEELETRVWGPGQSHGDLVCQLLQLVNCNCTSPQSVWLLRRVTQTPLLTSITPNCRFGKS